MTSEFVFKWLEMSASERLAVPLADRPDPVMVEFAAVMRSLSSAGRRRMYITVKWFAFRERLKRLQKYLPIPLTRRK